MTTDKTEAAISDFGRYYAANYLTLDQAVNSVVLIISAVLAETKEETPIHDVSGRVKTLDSALLKYNEKYREAHRNSNCVEPIQELITDLIAVRIVCLYEDDIPRIAERISQVFTIESETDKSKELEVDPRKFGYRALHYDMQLGLPRDGLEEYRILSVKPFELQMRTIFQDAWSVIDHQLKYKNDDVPATLARRINVFAALCELADQEFMRIRNEISKMPAAVLSNISSYNHRGGQITLKEFMDIARDKFETEPVSAEQADAFLAVLNRVDPNFGREQLIDAFNLWGALLEEAHASYRARVGRTLSPLTRVRVLLYLQDRVAFRNLVTSPELTSVVREAERLSKEVT